MTAPVVRQPFQPLIPKGSEPIVAVQRMGRNFYVFTQTGVYELRPERWWRRVVRWFGFGKQG